MKKLLFLVAFAGSATLGAACTSELTEACNDFVSARDGCEVQNGDPMPPYSTDLCGNIDEECREFYTCAAAAECKENPDGKFRLQTKSAGCVSPENKECTDADLRF
ncbi:MAG: hypothetical protein H0T76_00085 [Nannocystis sp.]|nr:hypothetical protein [Nannocystis sp.]MBA3544858.1 hypothetical protein [Nannocystis sp.]